MEDVSADPEDASEEPASEDFSLGDALFTPQDDPQGADAQQQQPEQPANPGVAAAESQRRKETGMWHSTFGEEQMPDKQVRSCLALANKACYKYVWHREPPATQRLDLGLSAAQAVAQRDTIQGHLAQRPPGRTSLVLYRSSPAATTAAPTAAGVQEHEAAAAYTLSQETSQSVTTLVIDESTPPLATSTIVLLSSLTNVATVHLKGPLTEEWLHTLTAHLPPVRRVSVPTLDITAGGAPAQGHAQWSGLIIRDQIVVCARKLARLPVPQDGPLRITLSVPRALLKCEVHAQVRVLPHHIHTCSTDTRTHAQQQQQGDEKAQ